MRALAVVFCGLWAATATAQSKGPVFTPPTEDPSHAKNVHFSPNTDQMVAQFEDRACGSAKVDSCEDLGGAIQVEYSQKPNGGVVQCDAKGCWCDQKVDCTKALEAAKSDGAPLPGVKSVPRLAMFAKSCQCVVTTYVPTQVTNALRGDVGLVPIGSSGDNIVRLVTSTIGQYHRHAVIYLDADTIRHSTSYHAMSDSDLESSTLIKPGVLANGTPGITTEDVDDALEHGRLASTGLVLKPGTEWFFRAIFEDAADAAEGAQGYYKISDYTAVESMDKDYSTSTSRMEQDDLRGTMCSGLVYWAFTGLGLSLSLTEYDEDIRLDAGNAVFDEIKSEVSSGFSTGEAAISFFVTGSAKKIANQVVNCFANLGCDDNDDTWKNHMGSGLSVSPDNLLPTDFELDGSGHAYWFGSRIDPGDDVDNANGADVTPFLKVEPQNLADGYVEVTVLTSW